MITTVFQDYKNLHSIYKETSEEGYLYQKGDFEIMRKDALRFAKNKYFNGHSDARSVQENLITPFIHNSADKHIPSKISKSFSTIPSQIHRRNEIHATAKKTGSGKLRTKFESLRREIKADIKSSIICM